MGWLSVFAKKRPAVQRGFLPAHGQNVWGQRVENVFFHALSWGFSAVSAVAIWQIFVSRHAGDIGRAIEGGVLAACFAIAGYFLSRNIAYRWMAGEMVYSYIPVCLVVELVEIYCNYVVGVSYLDLTEFFQTIPVSQHDFLLAVGRIVVSCIPAMTLFLAVAQMDMERRKSHAGPVLKQSSQGTHASTVNGPSAYNQGYGPATTMQPWQASAPSSRRGGSGGSQNNGAPLPGIVPIP